MLRTKNQQTYVCITRASALKIDDDVESIKFSYPSSKGQVLEGILFSRDPNQLPHQLEFNIERIEKLNIIVTKKDGAASHYTFTTK